MKRKILSALLCVAMTATMLAGCGDKADDSKNSDSDTQQEADNNAGDDKQEAADDAGDSEGGGNKLTSMVLGSSVQYQCDGEGWRGLSERTSGFHSGRN